jgi:hypothetical protein
MKNIIPINSPVTVTAMGFAAGMRAYPRRIEYGGSSYDFVGEGLHAVLRSGKQIVQLLTMSDGTRRYHLRSDNHGGSWTLLSMSR